jgi:hypothetical protein
MYRLACNYTDLGRHADALKLLEETVARGIKRDPERHTLWSMMGLAKRYSALGRHAEALKLCRQTAEIVEKLNLTDSVRIHGVFWNSADRFRMYHAACMRAVTAAMQRAADPSPAGAKQADAEADKAMALLKKAVAAGWKDAAWMGREHDLDALRDREDFKKLIKELTAGGAK